MEKYNFTVPIVDSEYTYDKAVLFYQNKIQSECINTIPKLQCERKAPFCRSHTLFHFYTDLEQSKMIAELQKIEQYIIVSCKNAKSLLNMVWLKYSVYDIRLKLIDCSALIEKILKDLTDKNNSLYDLVITTEYLIKLTANTLASAWDSFRTKFD